LTVDVAAGSSTVRMHNVTPRLSETPGEIRTAGGELGQDNEAVYGQELGLAAAEINEMRRTGVI